jgi:hypothetical protein
VIDDVTGEPLGGSVVELLGVRSRTVRSIVADGEGYFRLEVRPGVHQIRARSQGFLTSRPTEVAFPFEHPLHLEIRLSRTSVLLAPVEIVPPPAPLSVAAPAPR